MKRSILRVIMIGLLLLASGYFLYHLWGNFHQLPNVVWNKATVVALSLSVLGTWVTIALIALIWVLLLRDQNVQMPYLEALQIIAVSQMGKYLPGNIGHFTGRVLLGKAAGVPAGKTIATMAIETFWTLAISASFTLAALVFFVHDLHQGLVDNAHPVYMAALSIALLLAPFVGIQVFNVMLPKLSRKLGRGALLVRPQLTTAVMVSLLMMLCFAILGSILELQAISLFGHGEGNWLQLTLLFTVAWTVGYMLPGAPGGLGVREAMMMQLLTPVIGIEVALGVSLTMRATSMVGDASAFLLGMLFRPTQKKQPAI
ncbi:lysylphosphatidylglycerol synthase domain-containing protein [Hydrogenophaga sp. PAMC20947]|uniref:lysylphosphatidylglycerol synthase domain-containing protein n=1 Tax=Hydrogenophaga sp. PAMC20947 TaxID=2565558 RepID=UPI00109DE303|nr:lysylphosphatidylglycerol synthase domain-containing protein [Hydrogenophaga sp. PAMC20947]QCB46087.1 hypothetical protein E5678_08700 [Hydrogenophaga sp. PAMC20947]